MPPNQQPKRFEPYALTRSARRNVLNLNNEDFLKSVDISEIEEIKEQISFKELIDELPYTIETLRQVIESQFPEEFKYFEELIELIELPEGFFEWVSKLREFPENSYTELSLEEIEDGVKTMMQKLADQGVVLPEVSDEDLFQSEENFFQIGNEDFILDSN